MLRQLPVIIAGGGIGGLAAALGLARKGYASVVLEKAPRLGELGAFFQLGPNAFHALDQLGVGDAARRVAVRIDSFRLMDAKAGREITRIPLGDAFRSRFGNRYAAAHRGHLLGVLLRACRASRLVDLRTEAEVVGYEQDGASATAVLRRGHRVSIRERLVGDGAPRVSGRTAYRAVIPAAAMPRDLRWNAAVLWAGPGCDIVHYPLAGHKLFNLVATCENDATEPVAGRPVAIDEVRRGFERAGPAARRIIDRGRDWKQWVLCDREPVSKWVDGRVALLGDAAHPALPYLAQGAGMALEDAVCLAVEMAAHSGDAGRALPAYNRRRALRAALVQLQSRAIGRHAYHAAGAHAEVRNVVLRTKSAEDWYEVLDWLYGWRGFEGAVPREIGTLAAAE